MSSWRREGACNQCGECCDTQASFMVKKQTGVCRFLKQVGSIFICEITDNAFQTPPAEKPRNISTEQWEYYLTECVPYPNADEEGHCPPRHTLPPSCGYQIVEDGS